MGRGGEPASDFTITALEASRTPEGQPVMIATVRNTGGRALDLGGELRLTNGPGGLSAGPFTAQLSTTLGVDQAGPVRVPLDPAIPPGPWEAKIVLRSGTTERDATANVTFPEAAATSTGPVEAKPDSGGSPVLALAAAACVVLVLGTGLGLSLARRRRLTA